MLTPSRKAPPEVPPISHDGVRYQQVLSGAELGEPGRSGYLGAYDADTGERLWHVRVYEHERAEHLEEDVQDVFFASMQLLEASRRLLIENERGERFEVDIETRAVLPRQLLL